MGELFNPKKQRGQPLRSSTLVGRRERCGLRIRDRRGIHRGVENRIHGLVYRIRATHRDLMWSCWEYSGIIGILATRYRRRNVHKAARVDLDRQTGDTHIVRHRAVDARIVGQAVRLIRAFCSYRCGIVD